VRRRPGDAPRVHSGFLYVSPLDQSGVFDWYTYVNSVLPVNGKHPYTRDRWTGQSWIADDKHPTEDGVLVADTANRIAALDSLPPVLSVWRAALFWSGTRRDEFPMRWIASQR